MTTIAALTGHRPPKAGLTYSHDSPGDLAAVKAVRQFIRAYDIDFLIVGGALGFDTLGARAAWLEKIPYDVYVPFKAQAARWYPEAQTRYYTMLEEANTVEVISEGGFTPQKMQFRNVRMVDDARFLATWWDGSSGGTANCIKYAELGSIKVIDLLPRRTSDYWRLRKGVE